VFSLLVSCVDLLNSGVLKPLFDRSRPYETLPDVRVFWNGWRIWEPLQGPSIGETISFPSSHAANSFAAAVFLGATFKSVRMGFFTAAAVISFSRVYVGVHYPLDVIAGAMVGIFSGVLFLRTARIVWSALSGWKGSVRFHRWVESMSSEDRRRTDYYWPGVFLLAGAAWAWRHWEVPASSYGTVFPISILLAGVGLGRVALSLKRMHSVRGEKLLMGVTLCALAMFAGMEHRRGPVFDWGKGGSGAFWRTGPQLALAHHERDFSKYCASGEDGFLVSRPLYLSPGRVGQVTADLEVIHLENHDHVAIYYDLGSGFVADQAAYLLLEEGRREYVFPLQINTRLFRLRLDPTARPNTCIRVYSVRIEESGKATPAG